MRQIKTVAITGASGFLGSNLARYFADRGIAVRGLVRDSGRLGPVKSLLSASVVADINDADALRRLVNGCDTVIHTVSNFREVRGSEESYYQTNHRGTVTALEAASAAGVGRFVHCSTIGVHGDVEQTPAREDSPFNPGDLYQKTKLLAEQACRQMAKSTAMEVVVVRPTSQYGPGDLRMLKMFKMLAKGRFFRIGKCSENFHAVFIDDLVKGFWLASVTEGIDGETFLIGGENYIPLEEYIDIAAQAVGARRPWIRLPYWPMHGAGFICEVMCKPFGIEPPIHRRRIKFFKNNRAFDISRAQRILGYQPQTPLLEGMQKTVDWYRSEGLLD